MLWVKTAQMNFVQISTLYYAQAMIAQTRFDHNELIPQNKRQYAKHKKKKKKIIQHLVTIFNKN